MSAEATLIMVGTAPYVVTETYDEVMGALRRARAASGFAGFHLSDRDPERHGTPVSLRAGAVDTVRPYVRQTFPQGRPTAVAV